LDGIISKYLDGIEINQIQHCIPGSGKLSAVQGKIYLSVHGYDCEKLLKCIE